MIRKKETAGEKPKPVSRAAKASSTKKVAAPASAQKKSSPVSRTKNKKPTIEAILSQSQEISSMGSAP